MVENTMPLLEVCIDSVSGLSACTEAKPDRLELCSALDLGGLTPSAGFMLITGQSSIPSYAMIRPRAGDFCFDKNEIDIMCSDIAVAKEAGMTGVVVGASTPDGKLDLNTLRRLCSAAGDLHVTLHRVIDTLANPLDAIDQAIDLGINHILTSGGSDSVSDGVGQLARMQHRANGQIDLVAGAGLTSELVPLIFSETGITSFHSSCRRVCEDSHEPDRFGFDGSYYRTKTDTDVIRSYKQIINHLVL